MTGVTDEGINESAQQVSFEELTRMVSAEFQLEEALVEHNVPTYYLRQPQETKQPFLRLLKNLEVMNLIAILRRKNGKVVLKIAPKPPSKPGRKVTILGLLLVTLGTVFFSGYVSQSPDIGVSERALGALMFTGAILAILGSHEMGHKLLADKHNVDATYPYFIPGLPPIGTFGAVIQQKSLPPNKDSLFDLGFAGPVAGFLVSIIVTLVGIQLSVVVPRADVGSDVGFLQVPLLFRYIVMWFPPSGTGEVIMLHPVAFAGWVGMVITMLNLVPVGMFDGGHVARSLVGGGLHRILSYLGIALLAVISVPMAFMALFISFFRHPGPLDDVSKTTNLRKIAAVGLIIIFILCVVPIYSLF